MSNDHFALHPGYIDGPVGRPAPAAPTRRPPSRWRRCPAGPGPRSTSTRRTASRSPRVPAGSPSGWLRRLRRRRGLSERRPRTSSSSRWGRRAATTGSSRRTRGPGYSDIALVANHEFALDLITDDRGAGPGPAAVPSGVRGGPVRAVDRASRPGRCRRRRRSSCARRCARWRRGTGGACPSPRGSEADTGNGTHLHLSLWDGDRNLLAGRRRSGGDGAAGRVVHGGDPAGAAGARGRRRAELRELPATAAAALVGRDAVLGHGEP